MNIKPDFTFEPGSNGVYSAPQSLADLNRAAEAQEIEWCDLDLTGAMTKRMHAGRAAQSGVAAGLLARQGFTGSPDALEASYGGFMSSLADNPDTTTLAASLGSTWDAAGSSSRSSKV